MPTRMRIAHADADDAPPQTLFRVWDVFLVDGLDVLFRIALGILKCNEQELVQCESIPAVYVALENLPTRTWQPDKLLQVCVCVVAFSCVGLDVLW
jgi:hypothetical protein